MAKLAIEEGWQITGCRYDQEFFGNAFVDLRSKSLNIRITKDRGQIFIYVSKPGGPRWHNIVNFIGTARGDLSSENEVVRLLERNLLVIPGRLNEIEGQ